MKLFETLIVLGVVAVLLLQLARRLSVPYPTLLALAGVFVALVPGVPRLQIEPQLALALFIAPALVNAAYDFSWRELRRYWVPLVALAGFAVLITAAAVAGVAVALTGMPIVAAVALGAIVAPPDAAAAAAVLSRFSLPRRSVSVLKGESLLNDAVALLLFSAAVELAGSDRGLARLLPSLALEVPGGLLVGWLTGRLYLAWAPRVAGTLGGTLLEIVTTFTAWIVAEKLGLSAILSMVAFGMLLSRAGPKQQRSRDRVNSYAVWETTVFVLNVLAFLLMGLQGRNIVMALGRSELFEACRLAAAVLAVVVVVRIVWVLGFNRLAARWPRLLDGVPPPTLAQSLLVAWSGMRGLVTLATALALPADFPMRDAIALSAFAVVLGTLVVQGLTLGPLIGRLKLPADDSFDKELAAVRVVLLDAALRALDSADDAEAASVRSDLQARRDIAEHDDGPDRRSGRDALRLAGIEAQQKKLIELRAAGGVEDDVYHALERDLDWAQVALSPPEKATMFEG